MILTHSSVDYGLCIIKIEKNNNILTNVKILTNHNVASPISDYEMDVKRKLWFIML